MQPSHPATLVAPPPSAAPLAASVGAAPSIHGAGEGAEEAPGRRALIVEDEFLTSWHLSDMMSEMGFSVAGIAVSGEEAIRLAADTEPDVVLMDVHLKGKMDGVEAARTILAARDVPIIFVTAYTDDETVSRMKASGSAHRIAKPVTPSDLRTILTTALDSPR